MVLFHWPISPLYHALSWLVIWNNNCIIFPFIWLFTYKVLRYCTNDHNGVCYLHKAQHDQNG